MQRPTSLWILALVLLVVLVSPATAQVERASIAGTVTDKTGAIMAGVEVVVITGNRCMFTASTVRVR
jgi:hypothetical protein